jgi:methylglyoxal synthase
MRSLEPWFRHVLKPRILAVEGSHRALLRHGVLEGYEGLVRLPAGREGGVVELAARLVDPDPDRAIDWVIYLQDPADPTTLYPESLAVKRECVVNARPFLATAAAALEWCSLHWLEGEGAAPSEVTRRHFRPRPAGGGPRRFENGLALIAHDSRKTEMVGFAARHAALLSRFPGRLATGTTGGLLNGSLPDRLREEHEELEREAAPFRALGLLPPSLARRLAQHERLEEAVAELRDRLAETGAPAPWVRAMLSGPKGGDGQIAAAMLAGECRRVIFFEDPHVAREHEADIQLLERAARLQTEDNLCLHDPVTAERWAEAWTRCLEHPELVPVMLQAAFRRRFGCHLLLLPDGASLDAMRLRLQQALEASAAEPPAVLGPGDAPSAGAVALLTPEQASAALGPA